MRLNIHARQFFRNPKIRNLLISLLALSFIWPLQFLSNIFQPEAIDPSWMIALSEAWEKKFIFGQDIVFTYGPLSFLSTRVLLYESIAPLLCFDLFFAGSFVYIIYQILEEKYTTSRVAIILTTCFLFKYAMFLSLVFTLQFLILLYLIVFKRTGNKWLLLHAIVTTTLIFYIKFNLAFISIGIFILFITYVCAERRMSVTYAIATVTLLFLSIFIASFMLPVNLFKYMCAGLELIYSYNDAVYVYPSRLFNQALAIIILSTFLVAVLGISVHAWHKSIAAKIAGLLFIILAFIIFKQSYVRADIEHIKDFFFVFPTLLVLYLYNSENKQKLIYGLLFILWPISIFINYSIYKDYYYPIKKVAAFPFYFKTMVSGFDYYGQASRLDFPDRIKKEIGFASVDIIPWEASVLILNKLNYKPRPVIQSYQAYNQTLDQINAAKYNSEDGPEYVIYGINSIDKHYHFFDDTYLKIVLYKQYAIVDSFKYRNEELILFKRERHKSEINFTKLFSGKQHINEPVKIKEGSYPVMLKIKLKYSMLGELQKLFLRAPYSEMIVTQKSGLVDTMQIATSILEGGVLIDHFINNRNDAIHYFKKSLLRSNEIVSIQIKVDQDVCWKDYWDYEYYELR